MFQYRLTHSFSNSTEVPGFPSQERYRIAAAGSSFETGACITPLRLLI